MQAKLAAGTQKLLVDAVRGRETLRKGWAATCQINKLHNNIVSPVTTKNSQPPSTIWPHLSRQPERPACVYAHGCALAMIHTSAPMDGQGR